MVREVICTVSRVKRVERDPGGVSPSLAGLVVSDSLGGAAESVSRAAQKTRSPVPSFVCACVCAFPPEAGSGRLCGSIELLDGEGGCPPTVWYL
ncbi:hypothetical protein Pcinc_036037 [Petrolisthes cinctipes]|uniref:Uncharacterized protein n=1 Tax=Petrolisthes cinctipes TaxID=88211 RepID=A0AAE1EMD9_PETCI|nr:hypothetical protein Pcinc_036037 [Petrolisthes cinctipes]